MLGRINMSSSLLPADMCSCQTSGWRGFVDRVPLSLKVMFSCDINSLLRGQETGGFVQFSWILSRPSSSRGGFVCQIINIVLFQAPPAKREREGGWDRDWSCYSLVDIWADLLELQLLVGAAEERLPVRHIEQVHADVQVHRWLGP